jgi:hypothetical protein
LLRYRNIELLTIIFDVAKFTILTPLSLFISHKLSCMCQKNCNSVTGIFSAFTGHISVQFITNSLLPPPKTQDKRERERERNSGFACMQMLNNFWEMLPSEETPQQGG